MKDYKILINGKWQNAVSGKMFEVENPATGEKFAKVPECNEEDVDAAVRAAETAAPGWAATPQGERAKILLKASQLIMQNIDEMAKLETMEQGSPIRKTMNFDVPMCAEQLEYFAGVSRGVTGETLPVGPWCMSATVKEPIGVVGLITPWNFPALMVIWKLGAALVTGNCCIVKPPSVSPLTTIKLGEIFMEAGLPAGVMNVITGPGGTVGEALVNHPKVAKIGFTGDTATGKRIMNLASSKVKQVGLELGGKNAFIVLDDADVDAAVEGAIFGSYFNSGQVCAASSRFYLHDNIYDEFAAKFTEATKKLVLGDTMKMETILGPVAYKAHRDYIESVVNQTKEGKAKLLLGGERPDTPDTRNGCFVAPTIFGECNNDMRIMREELFGPVVCLCRINSAEEAVTLTNDSQYGLAASVWSKDVKKALQLVGQIKTGTVWINEHLIIFAETPWGGCKESGWGKDLSTMALDEYLKTKHIYIDLNDEPVKPWYGLLK